ncbi:MAG: hypothetical protein ACE5JH_08250 [Acidobacteriota bacterium]
MRSILKCATAAAVAAIGLAVGPAWAEMVVRESTCTHTVGSNAMSYDCGFNVRNYSLGQPVTVDLDYSCSGECGPVLSFGLRGRGFSPNGVSCKLVGGSRLDSGLSLTFVCDKLKKTGGGQSGNAHFSMSVLMDDGSGNREPVPCNVDVHVMSR